MGCTESVLSEMAAKSNQTARPNRSQAKVQPAPLSSDRYNRDDARERRRRAVADRQAKAQALAQIISENAMAEKERMSNSTWRSWKSGGQSDILSPAVSISFRGSDGTASLDNYPNPSAAYEHGHEDNQRDINANEMQIRAMTLPNQVTPHDSGPANERVTNREFEDDILPEKKGGMDGEKGGMKRLEENHGEELTASSVNESSERNQDPLLIQKQSSTTTATTRDGLSNENVLRYDGIRYGEKGNGESRKDDNGEEHITRVEKKKRKAKRKHKGVTFVDQVEEDDNGGSLETGRKSTSQGR